MCDECGSDNNDTPCDDCSMRMAAKKKKPRQMTADERRQEAELESRMMHGE